MTHLLRALVVWLGIYAACFVVFAALWFWSRSEGTRGPDEGAMLGGTIALWLAVQFGRAAARRLREHLAVGRADLAQGKPRDGELVVARGTLQCGAPLVAPFSGTPAVAYVYRAWRNEPRGVSEEQTETAYWWGEGSAPCTLLTRQGSLAVSTRPWLDSGLVEVGNSERSRTAFLRFLQGQQPQVVTVGLMMPGFDWDAPLDGVLRRDKVRGEPPPALEALTFEEAVLSPGEAVVLIGRYSAARGGLVHDEPNRRALRALKGDASEVRRQLRNGALAYGALATLALAGSALFAAQMLR